MCAFFIISILQVLGSGFMFGSFLIKNVHSTHEIVHNLCLSVPNSVGYTTGWGIRFREENNVCSLWRVHEIKRSFRK